MNCKKYRTAALCLKGQKGLREEKAALTPDPSVSRDQLHISRLEFIALERGYRSRGIKEL